MLMVSHGLHLRLQGICLYSKMASVRFIHQTPRDAMAEAGFPTKTTVIY